MRHRVRSLLLLAMVLLGFAAPSLAQNTLDEVVRRGVLRVGFDTFVPWAMKDKNGEYMGFEIDVARKLAEDMGVQVEFVPTKWSGIIPALLAGKFDIIIGGMGITPARNLKVNFSIPYEFSGMSIVANAQTASHKTSLDAFNSPDVVIAVKTGATSVAAVQKFMPKATMRMFEDEAQALQEVLTGRAHAMVASAPFPEHQAVRHKDRLYLPLAGQTFTREPIGFAVPKGDHDFLNFLNNWITIQQTQGWLEERYTYWFRTLDWQSRLQ
ncbi:MAG: transporter substrate-binding domain-containing protein [Desulfomicrobiaceae bacterium]